MAQYNANLPVLTFATSNSNAVNTDHLDALSIFCTSSSSVFTVQVEYTSTGTLFVDLWSGGSDVTITGPNVLTINPVPFKQVRLVSTYGSTGSASGSIAAADGDGFPVIGNYHVR